MRAFVASQEATIPGQPTTPTPAASGTPAEDAPGAPASTPAPPRPMPDRCATGEGARRRPAAARSPSLTSRAITGGVCSGASRRAPGVLVRLPHHVCGRGRVRALGCVAVTPSVPPYLVVGIMKYTA